MCIGTCTCIYSVHVHVHFYRNNRLHTCTYMCTCDMYSNNVLQCTIYSTFYTVYIYIYVFVYNNVLLRIFRVVVIFQLHLMVFTQNVLNSVLVAYSEWWLIHAMWWLTRGCNYTQYNYNVTTSLYR